MNGEILWSLLLKGTLIVGLASLAALFLRRSSGARRHVVWLAAIGALLVLPLAELRLPSYQVSTDDTPIARPFLTPPPLRTPSPQTLIVAPNLKPSAAAPSPLPSERPPFNYAGLLLATWATGMLLLTSWLTFGLARVAMLIRSGHVWQPQIYISTPLRRPIRILLCPGLRVPATAGIFRPVLLLPENAPEWPEERLRMIVGHEVAHVQRADWLWQSAAQLACAIHFFNPLVWIAARRLRSESEVACDDFVLGMGIEPTTYAQELLTMAKNARFQAANVVGMARTPHVEDRLRSIVDRRRQRGWVSTRMILGVLGSAALLVVPIGVVHAVPSLLNHLTANAKKRSKLPPIPWMPSKLSAPNVYLAQNGIAGLPGGFKVRLVGISVAENNDFWDTNGIKVKDGDRWAIGSPYWQGNVFHRWNHGFAKDLAAFQRRFVLEIESPEDMIAATCGQIDTGATLNELQRLNPIFAGKDDRDSSIVLPANDPSYGIVNLGIPNHADKGDYRVGIAGQNWTKVSATETPLTGGASAVGKIETGNGNSVDHCGISLSDEPQVYYTDKSGGTVSRMLLPPGKTLDPNLARRVELLDKDGNVLSQGTNLSHDNQGHELLTPDAESFARIAKIVLYTSPYRFVEFRNVPLRPDYEAETSRRLGGNVKGAAEGIAPGFSKKTPSGITVSLAGVAKAKLDGDAWTFTGQPAWRGDGAVLAVAPKTSAFTMSTKVWGKLPIYKFDIQLDKLPPDLSTQIVATGDIDRKFWLYGQYPSSSGYSLGTTAAYSASAKEGSVRVGIASGPWTIVKAVPVHVNRLPSTDEGSKAKSTGLEFQFDPLPTIAFLETNKTQKLTDQSLGEVARRFVAVTYSGKEVMLRASALGYKALEFFSLPARQGEGFNTSLLASDVKEIRLETRPYEWVEFTGIPLDHK